MKKHRIFLCIAVISLGACKQKAVDEVPVVKTSNVSFKEKMAGGTIYEVNIRQHTPEGTINAFIKDLPRLKDLGVNMLWIMPTQPIGVKNRKAPLAGT